MEAIHNKLVRDRIPEIIEAKGQAPVYRVLPQEEYLAALDQKLQEEMAEYLEDGSIEELCDILEVVYAIAAARGIAPDVLARIREQKNAKNGGFERRYYLEKVVTL